VARPSRRRRRAPHVVEDTIGLALVDPDAGWRDRPDMDPVRTATNCASVVARQRAADDALAESEVGPYVILGAGLDSFAQRSVSGVCVFEVDAPATQAWKRTRLAELGLLSDAKTTYVLFDFEAGPAWGEALRGAGLGAASPALVSLLGVTIYLTREALVAAFREAHSLCTGSQLVFSFSQPVESAPRRSGRSSR